MGRRNKNHQIVCVSDLLALEEGNFEVSFPDSEIEPASVPASAFKEYLHLIGVKCVEVVPHEYPDGYHAASILVGDNYVEVSKIPYILEQRKSIDANMPEPLNF